MLGAQFKSGAELWVSNETWEKLKLSLNHVMFSTQRSENTLTFFSPLNKISKLTVCIQKLKKKKQTKLNYAGI